MDLQQVSSLLPMMYHSCLVHFVHQKMALGAVWLPYIALPRFDHENALVHEHERASTIRQPQV